MKKWMLFISVMFISLYAFSSVYAKQGVEEEVGRSNIGTYNGGSFYEFMTKELIYEDEDDEIVEYMIRYYIYHDGNGGYAYQNGAVDLYVDNKYVTTFSDSLYVKNTGGTLLCGEASIQISKGDEHVVELRDTKTSAYTTINVEGVIFHGIPTYEVAFYDGFGNEIETQFILRNNAATTPEIPEVAGYYFKGWDCDFSVIKEDIVVNATWYLQPEIIVYDRYFTSDEVINIEDIKSVVYAYDENKEVDKTNLFFSGLEKIEDIDDEGLKISVTYTSPLNKVVTNTFMIYVQEINDNGLIRQISVESLYSVDNASVWQLKLEELKSIIASNAIIEEIRVESD